MPAHQHCELFYSPAGSSSTLKTRLAPGQFLGSYVNNQVLTTRLVQLWGQVFNNQKKKEWKSFRAHILIFPVVDRVCRLQSRPSFEADPGKTVHNACGLACTLGLNSRQNQVSLTNKKRSAWKMVHPHLGRKVTQSPSVLQAVHVTLVFPGFFLWE